MPSVEEDTTDEVKVFRTDDADKELASQTLNEDKNEITYQADLEEQASATDVPSTSTSNLVNGIGSKSHTAFSKPQQGPPSGGFESGAINGVPNAFGQNGFATLPSAAAAQSQLLLWNYAHGFMGQHYATLPFNPTSPLFFPRVPPAAPGGAPPPAHNGGNPLSLDPTATAKTGSPSFGSPYFPPTAGLSPSFADFYTSQFAPALARFSPMIQAASPANLSPIHSPASGTPIVPTQHMKPDDLLTLKPRIATSVSLPSSLQFRMIGNPLASMAQLRLPAVPNSVTNLANTLGASGQPIKMGIHDQRQRLGSHNSNGDAQSKKDHVKKPLNAFMLFMKENRQKLMQEKGYKERQSAELNKELGRLWHTLTHEEQQKYYQMARDERQKHMQQYPGWTARDNYAVHKKKKRKRDKSLDNAEMKKCRARFGLDQQSRWCKHCRRKKKCLWFREGQEDSPEEQSPPAQVSSTTHGSPAACDSKHVKLENGAVSSCASSPVSQQGLVSSTTAQRRTDEDDDIVSTDEEELSEDDEDDLSSPVKPERPEPPPAPVDLAASA